MTCLYKTYLASKCMSSKKPFHAFNEVAKDLNFVPFLETHLFQHSAFIIHHS